MAEKAKKAAVNADNGRNRLKARYVSEIMPALMKEKGYKNVNEVPKLEKIVLNMRLGDIKDNSKSMQIATAELEAICGQKAVVARAKKSVANFKLREGQPIGIKVTLRGERMYEFFDKLVSIALPRVRDFRGISGKSFDGRGNYALGIKLLDGYKRANHIPRNFLRASRESKRIRRLHSHYGKDRRRSKDAPCQAWNAFQELAGKRRK